MQQRSADLSGGSRQVAGAVGVDRVSLGLLGLGAVDIGPGGAVDARLRPLARKERVHSRRVGDVQLGQVDQHELVPRALSDAAHVVTEHSGRAGHQ